MTTTYAERKVGRMTAVSSEQQLYRVAEAMAILAISRTVIYEEMRSGRLGWVKRGRSRRIPAADIAEYLVLLKSEAKRAALWPHVVAVVTAGSPGTNPETAGSPR